MRIAIVWFAAVKIALAENAETTAILFSARSGQKNLWNGMKIITAERRKKMAEFLIIALMLLIGSVLGFKIGYDIGFFEGKREGRGE